MSWRCLVRSPGARTNRAHRRGRQVLSGATAWGSPYLAAQAAYLRHLGRTSTAEVLTRDGIYAVRTGVTSNTENGVLSESVSVSAATANELIAWFGERDAPASWLIAEGGAPSEVVAALLAAGYRAERSAWEMRACIETLGLDRWTARSGIRIEPVLSEGAHDAWLDIARVCGWIETAQQRRALKELHLALAAEEPGRLFHSVAWKGSLPVGMASAFFAEDTVLLASLAVLPDERRQGVGSALALARLTEARARGCHLAVLAPTPDGGELYEALGFEHHPQPPDRWFYLPSAESRSRNTG